MPHSKNDPASPSRHDPKPDPLDLALEVLDTEEEDLEAEFPGVPELLFARDQNGLPSWWPHHNPDSRAPWASLSESRSVLLERLTRTVPVASLRKPLSATERQNVVNGFRRIVSELRSLGYDTPE